MACIRTSVEGWNGSSPPLYIDNVHSTRHVLEAAGYRRAKLTKFVSFGGAWV